MKLLIINNLKNKYLELSEPIKASFWFTISSILQKGVSFITVPIFTRLLSASQFGLFNVYKSWLSIITIFATLSLHLGVFNNGMIKYENNRDEFTSSIQGLTSVTTLFLFFIYLLFHNYLNEFLGLPTLLVIFLFAEIFFVEALRLWSAKKRFIYDYKNLILVTIGISILNPIVGIIVVMLSDSKGIARIISFALVQICISLIIYIYNFIKGKSFFIKEYWKYALAFNIPLIPHYLSGIILSHADKIMINNFIGPDKAGIYSVAYSGSMVIIIVQNSINKSFVPWTYKRLKNKEFNKLINVSKIILILVSLFVVLLVLFAPEAIKILAPKEYYSGIWVVPPITSSVFFMFLYTLFANVEFYFEENKFIMFASVLAAILNIILNYLLLPIFGYLAAGYTTLFSYIIYSFSHFIFMKKISKKYVHGKDFYDYKFILILSILLILLPIMITYLYNYIIIRYSFITIIFIIIWLKRDILITNIKKFI